MPCPRDRESLAFNSYWSYISVTPASIPCLLPCLLDEPWIYTAGSLSPELNSCTYVVGLSLVPSLTPFPDIPIWDPWVGLGSVSDPSVPCSHHWRLSSTSGLPPLRKQQASLSLTGRQTLNSPETDLLSSQIVLSILSEVEDSSRKPKTHLTTELTSLPHCCTTTNLPTIIDITYHYSKHETIHPQ